MNSETYSRTGSFPVIPEKIGEFRAFVDRIESEGGLRLLDDGDNHFTILDGDSMWVTEECDEDADPAIAGNSDIDALEYIAQNFLAPGGVLTHAWAGKTGMRFVGGGAAIYWKELDGALHREVIGSKPWLANQAHYLRGLGYKVHFPWDE